MQGLMKVDTRVVPSKKGDITLYKLTNAKGASVEVSSLGAGIVSIIVPDSKGKLADVTIGYANPADSLYDGPCAGKVPGRYANRIAKGLFKINGKEYHLAINNGPNALHGGPEGFQNQIWEHSCKDGVVTFSRTSPDGEEGYPGTLKATVSYKWSEDNALTIELSAICDADTVVNLTNHTYYNLAGEGSGSVLDEKLWLGCSKYLPTDSTLIPTGAFDNVKGTPMDFTEAKALGKDIKQDFPALNYGKGYDNCWVVDNWKPGMLKKVAELTDEKSGRVLEVLTTQPAAQVYTGNWLNGCPVGKDGHIYHDYDGVAIECQGMPDAPNKPQFPSQLLKANETYKQLIKFEFKTK
jgi:aldose 1-epimerase